MSNSIWPPDFDFLDHLSRITRALEELIQAHNNLALEHQQVKQILDIQNQEIKQLTQIINQQRSSSTGPADNNTGT